MKHIAVHDISKVKTGELTEVWEPVKLEDCEFDFINENPNEWELTKSIGVIGANGYIRQFVFEGNGEVSVVYSKYARGQELKAYEPHKNKFINWWNKLNGVKVKVVGIDSKQIKDCYIKKWACLNKDGSVDRQFGIPSELNYLYGNSKDTHCIIYKLETV